MATDKEAPLGSIENPIKFGDQDFKTLLEECLKSGELFADPDFPADQKSIGMPEDPDPKKEIKWQRPKVDHWSVVHVWKEPVVPDVVGRYFYHWSSLNLFKYSAHQHFIFGTQNLK